MRLRGGRDSSLEDEEEEEEARRAASVMNESYRVMEVEVNEVVLMEEVGGGAMSTSTLNEFIDGLQEEKRVTLLFEEEEVRLKNFASCVTSIMGSTVGSEQVSDRLKVRRGNSLTPLSHACTGCRLNELIIIINNKNTMVLLVSR